jgi:hypothetical protein
MKKRASPCTAVPELTRKSIHLVKVQTRLVPTHNNNRIPKQRIKHLITQNMTSKPTEEEKLQQLGELADDLLAILAEERDDLGNEVRGTLVLEQLQLVELII